MLIGEIPGPIVVGRVSREHARQVGALHTHVWLSRDTLLKQLSRHRVIPLSVYEDLNWVFEETKLLATNALGVST